MYEVRVIETLADILDFPFDNQWIAAEIRNESETYKITYEKFRENVLYYSEILGEEDLSGKHIAIIGNSGYSWVVALMAIIYRGAVAVLFDNKISNEDMHSLIKNSECDIAFIDTETNKKTDLSSDVKIIEISDDFNDIKDKSGKNKFTLPSIESDSPAILAFTSGTTGDNKMVLLSHKNICRDIISCSADYFQDSLCNNKKIVPSIPFYHMFGLTAGVLIPLYYGMTIGYINGLKYLSASLALMKPHVLISVPIILENMFRRFNVISNGHPELITDKVKEFFGGNIEIIVSGGARLKENIYDYITDIGITLCNGYGMTECSPILTCNPVTNTRQGSVGKVVNSEDKEIRIIDNEILVRGNIVMNGYLKNDEENKKIFSKGWLKTGDLGYIDRDGYLFITGRKKNLIILSDGNNVSSEELENLISDCDLVSSVVVDCESNDYTEYLVAYIYPDYEYSKSFTDYEIKKQLDDYIRSINLTLPPYKRIASSCIMDKDFEKTSLGKVKKYKGFDKNNIHNFERKASINKRGMIKK